MNILGIVAEYNPFHNGHLYHLKKSIQESNADFTICIMSGNFLQRGEPALFNKWIRAETAVKNGVDIVIELPAAFACSSAEYFAKGAISILNGLGCVTHISFGSEHGDLDPLYKAAEILASESYDFQDNLKKHLSTGISFPSAREKSIGDLVNIDNILSTPNNILGIEYLKALIRSNSMIKPITISRKDAEYHSITIEGSICSATAIREHLKDKKNEVNYIKDAVPSLTYDTLTYYVSKGISPLYLPDIFDFIRYKLLNTNANELNKIFSVTEGIENRILNDIRSTNSIDKLISNVKSKRYTQTSIQRLLIHILLGLTKKDMLSFVENASCIYARILGFSSKGSGLLRNIKKSDYLKIPLITNINKEAPEDPCIKKMLGYDIMSSDIYHLISGRYDLYKESDYVKQPYRCESTD